MDAFSDPRRRRRGAPWSRTCYGFTVDQLAKRGAELMVSTYAPVVTPTPDADLTDDTRRRPTGGDSRRRPRLTQATWVTAVDAADPPPIAASLGWAGEL